MAATLDELVDVAVTGAELAVGVSMSISARRSTNGRRGAIVIAHSQKSPAGSGMNVNRWSQEELEFARMAIGHLSFEEIGAKLGRSANAVKIVQMRRGWQAASKQWHELTAHKISLVMRKCVKTIVAWIDLGILPGHVLPGGRNIHVVDVRVFQRWLINPSNWIYFDHRRIRDGRLRRLIELAKSRWPDRWLTTRQAAEIIGCEHYDVNRWIHLGKIPARKWHNQHVLESVARTIHIPKGRGSGHELMQWTARSDAFLVWARAEGIPWAVVARMMKQPEKRLQYRMVTLRRRGLVGAVRASTTLGFGRVLEGNGMPTRESRRKRSMTRRLKPGISCGKF